MPQPYSLAVIAKGFIILFSMRYIFVFVSIIVIWLVAVVIANTAHSPNVRLLFFSVEILTLSLFYLGFYRK